MYAIVEIAGQQFKVEKEQEIFVHRLEGEAGSTVEFDNVLLYDNEGKISVGTPTVDGILVKAKIVEHLKGDKVIVFHKKRRKGYQKQNGHRQYFSKIVIEDILSGAKKSAPKTEAKKEAPKKETPKKEAAPKAEVKADTKETPKKAAAKPKATKKTAEKKETPAKAKPKATKKAAPKAKAAAKPKAEAKEEKPEKKEVKKSDMDEKKDDK
ncbi:MAG: 50S ribosomal protein L21 [Bacteroidetes bacterium]|nr:50S ribosomal protein L21 [Bacteroidota bacterium]